MQHNVEAVFIKLVHQNLIHLQQITLNGQFYDIYVQNCIHMIDMKIISGQTSMAPCSDLKFKK